MKKDERSKSKRISDRIDEVIANIKATDRGGPFTTNRNAQRDNRREDWRAGVTKPTVAARTKKRRAKKKMR